MGLALGMGMGYSPSYYSTPYYSVNPNEVSYDSSSAFPSYYQTYQGPEEDSPDYNPMNTGASTTPKPAPKDPAKDPGAVPQIVPEKGFFPPATPLDDDLDP